MHENYQISNTTREANFKYFLMNQSAYESLRYIFSKKRKKNFFQALEKILLEKKISHKSKNRKKSIFFKNRFSSK